MRSGRSEGVCSLYVYVKRLPDGSLGGEYRDGRKIRIRAGSKVRLNPGEVWVCNILREGKRVITLRAIREVNIAYPPDELDVEYEIDVHRDVLRATYHHTDFPGGEVKVEKKFAGVMLWPPEPKDRVTLYYIGSLGGRMFTVELEDPEEIKRVTVEHGMEDLWDWFVDTAVKHLYSLKLMGVEVTGKEYGEEVYSKFEEYMKSRSIEVEENEEDMEI